MYQTNWRKLYQSLKEQHFQLKKESESLSYQLLQLKTKCEKAQKNIETFENLIPYGIWQCNARGELKYVSEKFLKLKGLTLKDVKDYGWVNFSPEKDKNRLLQKWQKCIETGDEWQEIYEIKDSDGLSHIILSRGCPIRNTASHIIGWIGVYLSITAKEQVAFLSKQQKLHKLS